MSTRTSLYRYFGEDGILLYIGISRSAAARLAAHSASDWSGEIRQVVVEMHPTRVDAIAAEVAAIKAERPAYNVAHIRAPRVQTCKSTSELGRWLARKGTSQIAFAKSAGLSVSYLSEILSGLKKPGRDAIGRIARATNGSVPPSVWFVA